MVLASQTTPAPRREADRETALRRAARPFPADSPWRFSCTRPRHPLKAVAAIGRV